MVASLKALLGTVLPPTARTGTERGGIAEWLVVVIALAVLVVGIFLTGADDILLEALGDAWRTVTDRTT